jgi:hypothetical protein
MQDLDEMYEHLSFSRLVNRLYDQTSRTLSMDAHVHIADEVRPWQQRLREDPIFPVEAFQTARATVSGLYESLGASREFDTYVHPSGHEHVGGPELEFIRDKFGDCCE